MVIQAVPLGPFTGGMNNRLGIDSIADDEVTLLQNLDAEADGSFTSRPAIVAAPSALTGTDVITLLGVFVRSADNESFLVAAVGTTTQLYQVSAGTWQQIWTYPASGFVAYDDNVVLSCATHSGGYWNGATFNDMPSMPAAQSIAFYQERFWAQGTKGSPDQSILFFSKQNIPSPPSSIYSWDASSDYIEVGPGDGQPITGLLPTPSSLVIFRSNSTYTFRYPTTPEQGTLAVADTSIGADNAFSFVQYESNYYVFCQGYLYLYQNGRYWPQGMEKMSFARAVVPGGPDADIRLSIFGRRLLLWYYGSLYCFSFISQTWSVWVSTSTYGAHFVQLPAVPGSTDSRIAYVTTGAATDSFRKLYRVQETPLAIGAGEPMTCIARTKVYSYDEGFKFKRLAWWGAEVRSAKEIVGQVFPVAIPEQTTVTWNDMNGTSWNDFGTWLNPLIKVAQFADQAPLPAKTIILASVKFGQDLQFLRAQYQISLQCDGTTRTSPARLLSITTHVSLRGTVTKKVT